MQLTLMFSFFSFSSSFSSSSFSSTSFSSLSLTFPSPSSFSFFTGTIDINLLMMPDAAKSSSECGLHQLNIREDESVNLFKKQRIEGWWPLFKQVEAEKKELTVR